MRLATQTARGEKRVRGRGGRREIGRNVRGNGGMIGKKTCV